MTEQSPGPGRRKTNGTPRPETSARLTTALADLAISRQELAARLHVSTRTVGGLVSGERGPSPETALSLAEALGDDEVVTWWTWPGSPPAPAPEVATRPRRSTRVIVLSGLAAVLIATTAAGAITHHARARDADPILAMTEPQPDVAVGTTTPLEGTLSSALPAGHTLWATLRVRDESRSHPQDRPCAVRDTTWTCDTLYVGTDSDTGRTFVVNLVDADASATEALLTYGTRDKTTPDAYAGLAALPEHTRTLLTVPIQRAEVS